MWASRWLNFVQVPRQQLFGQCFGKIFGCFRFASSSLARSIWRCRHQAAEGWPGHGQARQAHLPGSGLGAWSNPSPFCIQAAEDCALQSNFNIIDPSPCAWDGGSAHPSRSCSTCKHITNRVLHWQCCFERRSAKLGCWHVGEWGDHQPEGISQVLVALAGRPHESMCWKTSCQRHAISGIWQTWVRTIGKGRLHHANLVDVMAHSNTMTGWMLMSVDYPASSV